MNFNFENLVSAAVGAVSKVANAVVNALSPVAKGGGLFGVIAGAVIGAAIAVANVCEDGEIDEDEIEEILANVVKAYVGATMAMFGSRSSRAESDDKEELFCFGELESKKTISEDDIKNLPMYNQVGGYTSGTGGYREGDRVKVCAPNGKYFAAIIESAGNYGIRLKFDDEDGYKEACSIEQYSEGDFLDIVNDINTFIDKGSVIITNGAIKTSGSIKKRAANFANDFFGVATTWTSDIAKLTENARIAKVAKVGAKSGFVSTILSPIMEYENSMKPYEDDLEAAKEIDPDNYGKYNAIAHIGATADACTAGYVRNVLNTVPSVVQLKPGKDPAWTDSWVNTVNEYVNFRGAIEKFDDAFKDPVIGPKINQFLR